MVVVLLSSELLSDLSVLRLVMLLVHLSAIKSIKLVPGPLTKERRLSVTLRSKTSRFAVRFLAATVPICDGILAAALT
jgi:hypothetical protein